MGYREGIGTSNTKVLLIPLFVWRDSLGTISPLVFTNTLGRGIGKEEVEMVLENSEGIRNFFIFYILGIFFLNISLIFYIFLFVLLFYIKIIKQFLH